MCVYRKSDAIHSLSGLCSMLVCISVILLLCLLLFLVYIVCSLSVSLPDLANKTVHYRGSGISAVSKVLPQELV